MIYILPNSNIFSAFHCFFLEKSELCGRCDIVSALGVSGSFILFFEYYIGESYQHIILTQSLVEFLREVSVNDLLSYSAVLGYPSLIKFKYCICDSTLAR